MLKDITKGIKGNKTLYAIVSVVVVIIIAYVIWHIYKAIKTGSQALGQTLGTEAVSIQTGIPVARVGYIRSEASRLWDDGYTSYLWGSVETIDQDMFISVINAMTSTKEVALLDEFFKERGGKRIKDILAKVWWTDDVKNKINSNYYNVLQA